MDLTSATAHILKEATMSTFPTAGFPIIGGLIPATFGKIIFVDSGRGSDGNSGLTMKRAVATVAKAYDLATTGENDVICLCGDSTHTLTSMLTVAKNRVHFVGLGVGKRHYGQSAKINMGLTTAATDIATIKVTGIRCSFTNLKITNTNAVGTNAACLYTFVDGGEYTSIKDSECYKEGYLGTTLAAEFVANGDSGQYENCTFGSLANYQTGTTIRPAVSFTQGLAGTGLVARDILFKDSTIWKNAGHINGRHVYGANATDIERIAVFENCTFINSVLSAAVPAQCVAFGATLTVGQVLLKDCVSINNTKLSTTTNVFVSGAVPTAATSGIAVQGA
jgi:hypothetical protein